MSTAERVEVLAAAGAPWERIALDLGLSVEELHRCYGDELVNGPARVRQRMEAVLYRKAVASNVTAIRLWLKYYGDGEPT